MSKALDIVMAGVISGIVAYTTSQLGVTGTIIGAVIGSMLYQVMSHIFREPLDGVKTQRVERSIFYIFPLIVILIIEIVYLFYIFSLPQGDLFFLLERATGWNLFRTIGLALIIMGLFPFVERRLGYEKSISRKYGYVVLAVGVVKLLGGFADLNSAIVNLYSPIFYQLNEIISIMVVIALLYVIIAITRESVTVIYEKDHNKESEDHQMNQKK
ncbi:hypothetical protein FGU46_07135 [Methanobacterium sp. CWC-01]|jgi:hypothetical protein|uniref:hypothetical protein n=1 Tax=Methanobacterium aridiramus TaxID=2584467 RepID=UPI0025749E24|nr:hypothetical protein [Methanobacterium sp. CWC-01]WJI09880.1 hypothetical protein FGU46_07135 [Methanobacterium sp. CWC-01]